MPAPPKQSVIINDFQGLITNIDPRDLPPGGAEEQVNACCIILGQLDIRKGIKEVEFDNL